MLGFTLRVAVYRAYTRSYSTHRKRMLRFLGDLGATVTLPEKRSAFAASYEAIVSSVHQELERVSRPSLGWALLGGTLIDLGLYGAFKDPRADDARKALHVLLGKLGLSTALVSRFERACQPDQEGRLSWRVVHSAALATLKAIISKLPPEPNTAFVAMPFSVRRMAARYTSLYVPLLKALEQRAIRAWGGFGTEEYQVLLYTLIEKSGTMLADITTLNANVMHELGYALGQGNKFVIVIGEKGQAVPANLGDLSVLLYSTKTSNWEKRAAGELATTVALYRYAATIDQTQRDRRLIGPMKVVHD